MPLYPSFDSCTCVHQRHWHWLVLDPKSGKEEVQCQVCKANGKARFQHEFKLREVFET